MVHNLFVSLPGMYFVLEQHCKAEKVLFSSLARGN